MSSFNFSVDHRLFRLIPMTRLIPTDPDPGHPREQRTTSGTRASPSPISIPSLARTDPSATGHYSEQAHHQSNGTALTASLLDLQPLASPPSIITCRRPPAAHAAVPVPTPLSEQSDAHFGAHSDSHSELLEVFHLRFQTQH